MYNHTANNIRQLCSLGLPSHQTVPQILELIHDCIPSYGNVYFWFDSHQELREVYDERPEALVLQSTYMENFHNRYERDIFSGWSDSLKYRTSVSTDRLWKADRKAFFKHRFYGEFLSPLGYHWGLHRPIKTSAGHHGIIQLHRSRNDNDFTDQDAVNLDRIARYMEYSFSISQDFDDSTRYLPFNQGYLSTNTDGELLYYSPGAERLATLAISDGDETIWTAQLPGIVKILVNRLMAMSKGIEAETPSMNISNKWGKFHLMAFFMNPMSSTESKPIITIRIEQYKLSQLVLLKNLENYKLTTRQKEVCLSISSGKSDKEIAVKMGVKLSTIISHKKELFGRMNVDNRHQLIDLVLSTNRQSVTNVKV